jgi:hypothetical protein
MMDSWSVKFFGLAICPNAPHGLTKAEGYRMALDVEHKDLQLATGRQ